MPREESPMNADPSSSISNEAPPADAPQSSHRRGRRRWPSLVGPAVVIALLAVGTWRFVHPVDRIDEPMSSFHRDDPAGGVAALEAASAERPDDPTVWRRLGSGYARLAHQTADPSLYRRSDMAFDRAEQLEPGAPATAVARAVVEAVKHQFLETYRLATSALAIKPLDPDALVILVDAEVELGRYDAAVRDLQTLLDHKPSMAGLARATYLRELHGDLDGALEALRQAEAAGAQARPADVAQTMRIRADVLYNHGRIHAAEAVYRDILRIEPDYPDARIGLARVAAAEGDPRAGIRQ